MKLQVLQLEPYDDYVSVRDRLAFVHADRVLLVWPKGGAVLDRKLDLVLIQREVARAKMRLALVTSDPDVIENAGDLNISTFPNVDSGSRGRWKKPRNKVFIDRADKPEEEHDRYELMLAASRLRKLPREELRRRRNARAITLTVLFATALTMSYILFPYARVNVFMARDQLNATIKLVADPTIAIENFSTGHIPASLVSNILVERQASIPTTGSADVPATVASGTVILTNQTPDPVSIPTGTIVSTLGVRPARFRTLQDALINGYGNAEVTIAATSDSAGPIGNVEANLINLVEGSLNGKVAVRNPARTQGGTIRQQGIVTKEDQARLITLLRDQIRSSAVADITLSPTQFIAPGSIQIVEERPEWTTYSNFIGDATGSLSLTLKVRVQALVIDELSARKAAYASLAAQLANRQIVVDSVTYQRGKVDPVDDKGMAAFLMTASADAVNAISPDAIRNQITGMNITDARALLDRVILLDPRRPPQIELSPAFLGRLPLLGVRIEVNIK